jgi:AcrR family transcriptional regulator
LVKIEDKEKAILEAAITVFAERGFWNTPTSLISKTAHVAEGTLFNYFATKDDLINAVYLDIKNELAEELMSSFRAQKTVREKMRANWNRYIEWGVQNPDKFNVLQQISTSFKLDANIRAQGMEPFAEIERLARESIAKGEIHDYPVEYLGAFIDTQAALTIRLSMMNPNMQAEYQHIGFEILWNGVTR